MALNLKWRAHLLITIVSVLLDLVLSNVYHITPSKSGSCHAGHCLITLSQFAEETSNYLTANTTMIFLSGNHSLESVCLITGISELSMVHNSTTTSESSTFIKCNRAGMFKFSKIHAVYIKNLTFVGCIGNQIMYVNQFVVKSSIFIGQGHTFNTALIIVASSAKLATNSFMYNFGKKFWSGRTRYFDFDYYSSALSLSAGAITANGSNITVTDSRFEDNREGVIFGFHSNILVLNTVFSRNYAMNGSSAISSLGNGTLTINNSQFANNFALSGVGAIFAGGYVNLTITHTQFFNNSAESLLSGAIAAFIHTYMTISQSKFIQNSSPNRYGGVLLVVEKVTNVNITHSIFIKNTAGTGGVMYIEDGFPNSTMEVSISHCQFTNNSARSGGILFIELSWITDHSSIVLSITYSQFINNSAVNNDHSNNANCELEQGITCGGAIHMLALEDNVYSNIRRVRFYIEHSQFINNFANGSIVYGGVIHYQGDEITITHSYFINNKAQGGRSYGGVILTHGALSITHSHFINNHADLGGGSIFLELYKGGVMILFSSFINSSSRDGGVMWMGSSVTKFTLLTVSNSTFDNNIADNNGGVLWTISGINVAFNCCTFYNNAAGNDGGVMVLYPGTRTTINKSRAYSNSAGNNGGVIALKLSSIVIHEGHFYSNSAGHDGGAFQVYQGDINISVSICRNNTAKNDGGVVISYQGNTTIRECFFIRNSALNDGGALNVYEGNLSISKDTQFITNMAINDGGALHAYQSHTLIMENVYTSNEAANRGGVWFLYQGHSTISQNIASRNKAVEGGVLHAIEGDILIDSTSCVMNKAISRGGAMHTDHTTMTIYNSSFSQNLANNGGGWFIKESKLVLRTISSTSNTAIRGGAIFSIRSHFYISSTTFKQNMADSEGGAIFLSKSQLQSSGLLHVQTNRANIGILYLLESTANFSDDSVFSDNSGSVLAINSHITFTGTAKFINGSEPKQSYDKSDIHNIYEGGALTAIQSEITIDGSSIIINNYAQNGGALLITESKVYINGETTISNNTANDTGGGLYLYMSEMNCQDTSILNLVGNSAASKGGGAHVISSVINVKGRFVYSKNADIGNNTTYLGALLHLSKNTAKKGGALCFDSNAKLYILNFVCHSNIMPFYAINFTANSADYGGAVYMSDDSNPGQCNGNQNSYTGVVRECTFQTITILSLNHTEGCTSSRRILFSNNRASISGSSLFGGLLNRCKLHYLTLMSIDCENSSNLTIINGFEYMMNISNINISEIGSQPVQLCFCKHSQQDCNYTPGTITARKGRKFSIELVAVDQTNHSVNATIDSFLLGKNGALKKIQGSQNTTRTCTNLTFNLFSSGDKAELVMYVESPCISPELPQRRLTIQFTACDICPIGFQKYIDKNAACKCVCDPKLIPFISKCNDTTETLERHGNFWISYIHNDDNDSDGYLIYPHCPFNYCWPPTSSVEINLNTQDGTDAQCANGHSGILCGRCLSNLSLSLGSSHCIPCSRNKYSILVLILASSLAGIALVTLILGFNLTVATGTLNGIIFYANIISANNSIFLPFTTPTFASTFISWLNLDIGFDLCFFSGMDAYWKTLLQLAFPMYIIILVIIVIVISEHSTKFAQLIAKRNPVAALATLILLSYTKFLNTVIASLSFATLDYPNGSRKMLWLPDANIQYLHGKHIILFVVAIVILLIGALYTLLLLFWQWILQFQDKLIILKWSKNLKLSHFIEPYHAPYTSEQRYWTGLLLLVRITLYIISAVNISGDPPMNITSTNILICFLPLLKAILRRRIYKEQCVDIMETIVYLNLASFAALRLAMTEINSQVTIAYISIIVTYIQLLVVIAMHVYRYMSLPSIMRKIKTIIIQICKRNNNIQQNRPLDDHDSLRLVESVEETHVSCQEPANNTHDIEDSTLSTPYIMLMKAEVENNQ